MPELSGIVVTVATRGQYREACQGLPRLFYQTLAGRFSRPYFMRKGLEAQEVEAVPRGTQLLSEALLLQYAHQLSSLGSTGPGAAKPLSLSPGSLLGRLPLTAGW